jgi:hypothetical protein
MVTRLSDVARSREREDPAGVEVESLLQWERDTGLFAPRWLGVSPWRLIRRELIVERLATRFGGGKRNYNEPGAAQLGRMLIGAIVSLWHLFRLRRRPYLFVGFPRRRKERGVWVDTFSDPLIEVLGEDDCVCLEKPFTGRHFRPARTRRLVYCDGIVLLAAVCATLLSWPAALLARRRLSAISGPVSLRIGIGEGRLRRLIARRVIHFRVEEAGMRLVVAIVRPRALLLTNRWTNAPAIRAAKRRGVRVFELQHGAVPVNAFGYATPFDPDLDPDWMLTFGTYWNRFDWGLPPGRAVAIGHCDTSRRAGGGESRGECVMLVSRPRRHAEVSAWFDAIVRRHPGRRYVLRLHPQDVHDWHSRYPVGALANVETSSEEQENLYDAFASCNVVLGTDSTLLYEAASFGLKVGILNFDGLSASAALEYAGRCNFREIRDLADLDRLLAADTARDTGENPFFVQFDAGRFRELVG